MGFGKENTEVSLLNSLCALPPPAPLTAPNRQQSRRQSPSPPPLSGKTP